MEAKINPEKVAEAEEAVAALAKEIMLAESMMQINPNNKPYYYEFHVPSRNPQLRRKCNLFPEMRSGMPVSRRKRDRW